MQRSWCHSVPSRLLLFFITCFTSLSHATVLQALAIEQVPYVITKTNSHNNTFRTGYMIEYMRRVAKELNLTLNYTTWPPSDYNGAVEVVAAGRYDIAIGDISVTYSRSQIVDFTTYTYFDGYSIAVLPSSDVKFTVEKLFRFRNPFTLTVWVLIIVCVFILAASIWLYNQIPLSWSTTPYSSTTAERLYYLTWTPMSSWDALWFAFFQTTPSGGPVTIPQGRWVTVVGSFLFWILVAQYGAELTSLLAFDTFPTTSITGIEYLKKHNNTVAALASAYSVEVGTRLGLNVIEYPTPDAQWEALLAHEVEGVLSPSGAVVALQYAPPYCDVMTVADFAKHPWAWPVGKNASHLLPQINMAMLKLQEQGVPLELQKAWITQHSLCPPVRHIVSSGTLTTAGGILIVFPLLLFIVLVRILFRWAFFNFRQHYWKRRNNQNRKNFLLSPDDVEMEDIVPHPPTTNGHGNGVSVPPTQPNSTQDSQLSTRSASSSNSSQSSPATIIPTTGEDSPKPKINSDDLYPQNNNCTSVASVDRHDANSATKQVDTNTSRQQNQQRKRLTIGSARGKRKDVSDELTTLTKTAYLASTRSIVGRSAQQSNKQWSNNMETALGEQKHWFTVMQNIQTHLTRRSGTSNLSLAKNMQNENGAGHTPDPLQPEALSERTATVVDVHQPPMSELSRAFSVKRVVQSLMQFQPTQEEREKVILAEQQKHSQPLF
eukprot:TRINITY_DN33834_c0_g1_i1.p1 TRINITY_DN33834_c0_g1~~TRINITY_DN33834_c0_g1_i1.p1  ORF type:complete len:716 (-),score=4.29 TRINITY_DN33834_c0_g1_i1:13-2160(-)